MPFFVFEKSGQVLLLISLILELSYWFLLPSWTQAKHFGLSVPEVKPHPQFIMSGHMMSWCLTNDDFKFDHLVKVCPPGFPFKIFPLKVASDVSLCHIVSLLSSGSYSSISPLTYLGAWLSRIRGDTLSEYHSPTLFHPLVSTSFVYSCHPLWWL